MAIDKFDLVQQIAQLNLASTNRINTLLTSYGVNSTNYFYIMKIGENPGVSQRDFNEIIHMNHSTITRAVNQLIKKGLVKKTTNLDDNRLIQLYLTSEGEKLNLVVTQQINQFNSALKVKLGDNSQDFYDTILNLRYFIENNLDH